MATSFAAYASQFLNRQNPGSSIESSQPLFYSFSTEAGSRTGHSADADLDDLDDPHLRASDMSHASTTRGYGMDYADDDDPYLRLDEEEQQPSEPLLASGTGGWLAHHTMMRSPSPDPSSIESRSPSPSPPMHPTSNPPLQAPPPTLTHISLTESLLPRDGAHIFSLPDPRHLPRGRRKYHDSIWTSVWCAALGLIAFFALLVLLLTHQPKRKPVSLPYTTLLHTVPLLTILTFLSAGAAYAHVFLLRLFVRPVMIATSVFIPATLFISALWAFIGSFMWDANTEPTWGETVGLRLFALVPLILSLLTARRLLDLPRDIHTASALLTLTTKILIQNPLLLALSPTILLAALLASLPFLTLVFRLLLIGYTTPLHGNEGAFEWHVRGWANWAIAGTVGVWLWSWAVARGVLRVTAAGVIGSWYYMDYDAPPPQPTSTHTIHAALTRATQPSLGTIVLSSLILTSIRMLSLSTALFRALPSYLPLVMRPYAQPICVALALAITKLEVKLRTSTLSTHALIYVGLTGDPFWNAARKAREVTARVEGQSEGKYKRKFKTEPPLTLLTVAPLTLTFPFSLATYLFVAHTLNAPEQALGASVLAGGVTAIVGLFCIGLIKDTSDTLYLCYCLDKDSGGRRRDEVFDAFEYETRQPTPRAHQPQTPAQTLSRQPHESIPHRTAAPLQPAPPSPPRHAYPDYDEESEIGNYPDLHATSSTSHRSLDKSMGPSFRQNMLASSPAHGAGAASEHSEGEGFGGDSQLFPGSDLF